MLKTNSLLTTIAAGSVFTLISLTDILPAIAFNNYNVDFVWNPTGQTIDPVPGVSLSVTGSFTLNNKDLNDTFTFSDLADIVITLNDGTNVSSYSGSFFGSSDIAGTITNGTDVTFNSFFLDWGQGYFGCVGTICGFYTVATDLEYLITNPDASGVLESITGTATITGDAVPFEFNSGLGIFLLMGLWGTQKTWKKFRG